MCTTRGKRRLGEAGAIVVEAWPMCSGRGRWSNFSVKLRPRFEYQWPDKFKIHTYAKSDQNIPCGSQVMSIFANLPRPAGLKLSKAPTIKTMLRMTVVL